jgi:four helix bundle protein
MRNDKENLIVELSVKFALDIIDYCEVLEGMKKFIISRQLLKSGTSIGANVSEAQNAESKVDFVHKMKIAAKEADETKYWLILCERSPKLPN